MFSKIANKKHITYNEPTKKSLYYTEVCPRNLVCQVENIFYGRYVLNVLIIKKLITLLVINFFMITN